MPGQTKAAAAIIRGRKPAGSDIHRLYVAVEGVKLVALLGLTFVAGARVRTRTQAVPRSGLPSLSPGPSGRSHR